MHQHDPRHETTAKLRAEHEANPTDETAAALAVHMLLIEDADRARATGEGAEWWQRLAELPADR